VRLIGKFIFALRGSHDGDLPKVSHITAPS
jgi:hypothetical protein